MPARLRRLLWLLWPCLLALYLAVLRYPISTLYTRAGSVGLLVALWAGLLVLLWRHRSVRFTLLGVTAAAAIFLALPIGMPASAEQLRADYTASLRRYDGVIYVWGGENAQGIDCSGLVRRGLINALSVRGLRTFNPSLLRQALVLWWNDTTASSLGAGEGTVPVQRVPSLNAADAAPLLPGDLAVTLGGAHIMAYLGEHQWIEADPQASQVLTITTPAKEYWFNTPMNIVRWKALAP